MPSLTVRVFIYVLAVIRYCCLVSLVLKHDVMIVWFFVSLIVAARMNKILVQCREKMDRQEHPAEGLVSMDHPVGSEMSYLR